MKERRSVKTWREEKVKFFSEEYRERGSVNDTKKKKGWEIQIETKDKDEDYKQD